MTTSSQPVVRRLKYEMCKNWRERGTCKYGDKCLFAHGDQELTKRTSAPAAETEKPKVEPPTEPKESEKVNLKEELKESENTLENQETCAGSVATPSFNTEAKNCEKDDSFETPKKA